MGLVHDNKYITDLLDRIFSPELPYRSIKKDYSVPENQNHEMCAQCGGVCCKRCGCHFSPDDFPDVSFETLKSELEKGYISIDFVDGETIYESFGIYILRVRNFDSPIVDTGHCRKHGCILLSENGCKLDYDHRPSGGRLLIPSSWTCEETNRTFLTCHNRYDIRECCYEWKPHQKVIRKLIKYFGDKNIPCSL